MFRRRRGGRGALTRTAGLSPGVQPSSADVCFSRWTPDGGMTRLVGRRLYRETHDLPPGVAQGKCG